MKRYRIKIIKKYTFDLSGKDKEDINYKVDTVMNESDILNLPYVRKNIRVKIKEIKKGNNDEENN